MSSRQLASEGLHLRHAHNNIAACFADISPGFSGSGPFFDGTFSASPIPKIGAGGVSGLMLAASNTHGTGVQGYIC